MVIRIHFDGACHNIPGLNNDMGVGVAVFFDDEYQEEYSQAKFVKYTQLLGTSNIAEWTGCQMAMKNAFELRKAFPGAVIQIFSDSQLITYQFNGNYAIKKEEFRPFYELAKKWADGARVKHIVWIKRELNTEADRLSKIGLHDLKPDKQYWYYHDESDSYFIVTEAQANDMMDKGTTCGDIWQVREVRLGEVEDEATIEKVFHEHQQSKKSKVI